MTRGELSSCLQCGDVLSHQGEQEQCYGLPVRLSKRTRGPGPEAHWPLSCPRKAASENVQTLSFSTYSRYQYFAGI